MGLQFWDYSLESHLIIVSRARWKGKSVKFVSATCAKLPTARRVRLAGLGPSWPPREFVPLRARHGGQRAGLPGVHRPDGPARRAPVRALGLQGLPRHVVCDQPELPGLPRAGQPFGGPSHRR